MARKKTSTKARKPSTARKPARVSKPKTKASAKPVASALARARAKRQLAQIRALGSNKPVAVMGKSTRVRHNVVRMPNYTRSLKMDAQRKALPPGKRISKNGKVYYEYRSNRADINQKTRL